MESSERMYKISFQRRTESCNNMILLSSEIVSINHLHHPLDIHKKVIINFVNFNRSIDVRRVCLTFTSFYIYVYTWVRSLFFWTPSTTANLKKNLKTICSFALTNVTTIYYKRRYKRGHGLLLYCTLYKYIILYLYDCARIRRRSQLTFDDRRHTFTYYYDGYIFIKLYNRSQYACMHICDSSAIDQTA